MNSVSQITAFARVNFKSFEWEPLCRDHVFWDERAREISRIEWGKRRSFKFFKFDDQYFAVVGDKVGNIPGIQEEWGFESNLSGLKGTRANGIFLGFQFDVSTVQEHGLPRIEELSQAFEIVAASMLREAYKTKELLPVFTRTLELTKKGHSHEAWRRVLDEIEAGHFFFQKTVSMETITEKPTVRVSKAAAEGALSRRGVIAVGAAALGLGGLAYAMLAKSRRRTDQEMAD